MFESNISTGEYESILLCYGLPSIRQHSILFPYRHHQYRRICCQSSYFVTFLMLLIEVLDAAGTNRHAGSCGLNIHCTGRDLDSHFHGFHRHDDNCVCSLYTLLIYLKPTRGFPNANKPISSASPPTTTVYTGTSTQLSTTTLPQSTKTRTCYALTISVTTKTITVA